MEVTESGAIAEFKTPDGLSVNVQIFVTDGSGYAQLVTADILALLDKYADDIQPWEADAFEDLGEV
jgi:hypothetical protein